jgi:hypothetical protein
MAAGTVTYTSDPVGPPRPAAPAFPADIPPALAARFRESYDWFHYGGYPTGGGGTFHQFDGPPNLPAGYGRGATGSLGDRKGGKDLPRFWSELDLRGYRVMSRWLWDTNPFMIGFGRALTDYHIGKGWQWQACRKGQKKQAYATGAAQADPLTTKAQNVLDGWRDQVGWPLLSREGFRRLHRDGEVVQRLTPGRPGHYPEHRFVNPEQIGSPTGETSGPDSYGVRRGRGDGADEGGPTLSVYVRDHDGDGAEGRWEDAAPGDPAARVLFHKTNTDSDVKRGLPDSFSVHEPLDECRKLVRNMVVVACAQSAVAWLEKFPTAGAAQVGAGIPTGSPRYDTQPPGSATIYSDRIDAGTVLRTEASREYEPGPVTTGVTSYVEAEQAALRMACVRWGFPPYLTAKADDINFASSLTAGSPFAVAVEGGQIEWGAVEKATALKVLDLAVESGLLTWEERQQLDVEAIPPAVVSPDKGADTERLLGLLREKVVDPYTVQQELGYDPSHIEANWKAWNERNPQPAAAPAPPQQPPEPPDPFDGGLGESRRRRAWREEWARGGDATEAALDAAFARFLEDRTGLVKKQITNKAGHKQTVWVAPNDHDGDGYTDPGRVGSPADAPSPAAPASTTPVHRAVAAVKKFGSAAMQTRLGKVIVWAEHKLAVIAHKTREVAAEAGRRRKPPMTEDGIKRLNRVLAVADFIGGTVAGGLIGATVHPLAGKFTSTSLPTVSALYVAYSAVRDPAGTWAAARQVARDTLAGKSHAHEGTTPDLADRLAALLGGDDADWREAVFLAALAETGDAARACEVAEAAGPMPEQLPEPTADDFGGEPTEGDEG